MKMMRQGPSPFLTLVAACAVIFLSTFLVGSGLYYRVLSMACLYGALALSWNIFALTGSISLGHAAFFGLGAYGSALLCQYWHWSPYMSVFFGGIVGCLYGLIWHLIFRKLRGAAFALATLASVEIPKVIVDNWDWLTSGSLGLVGIAGLPSVKLWGMTLDVDRNLSAQCFFLMVFALAVSYIHVKAINSRWGWAIRSVREDEVAASTLGVDASRTRLQALSVSAFLTGLCGAVYAHLMGSIEPALVFSMHFSALPLVLSIFGGRYLALGPLLGTLILYPADQLMFRSWLPAGHGALYGLVMVIAILFFPHGIGEWIQKSTKSA